MSWTLWVFFGGGILLMWLNYKWGAMNHHSHRVADYEAKKRREKE